MTALILLLIPTAILAIFLVPKSKSDIPDDVTVGAGDLFPKESAIQLGGPDDGESPLFPVAPMGVIEGFYSHDD
jgi:hypothetical protein